MAEYEREWREGITRSLDDSAKSHQATAVILERLKGQLDNHDARIKVLENAPEKAADHRRNDVTLICTIVGAIIGVSVCGNGLLGLGVTVWLHFVK